MIGYSAEIAYHGFVALMEPEVFLELATPLSFHPEQTFQYLEKVRLQRGWGPPVLWIDMTKDEVKIRGHEGRHRTAYILENCPGALIPIHIIIPRLRAHKITRQMLSHIRSGAMSEAGLNGYIEGPLFSTVFVDGRTEEWFVPEE